MNNLNVTYQHARSTWQLKFAKWVIGAFIVIGFCSNFIANDVPLLAKYEGRIVSPVTQKALSNIGLSEDLGVLNTPYEWKVMPPIPYASDQLNSKINISVGPFDTQEVSSLQYRHWLGTDHLGRDVLAGLIHGSNIALKVGLLSVLFSLLIGVYIGLLGGFYGDDGWKSNLYALILMLIIKGMAFYYIIFPIVVNPSFLYYLLIICLVIILLILIHKLIPASTKPTVNVPLDLIFTKIIEVLNSIPSLFIVLSLLALFSKPSIWNVILIISIIGWPKFARLVRAEILQIKNLEYIQSAKSIGLSDSQILYRHALPNALTSIISITAFAISGAILLESTLSFLGLGIPLEEVSWGSMLADSRNNYTSWWLAVFPGFSIFLVLYSFYLVGNKLNQKLSTRESG